MLSPSSLEWSLYGVLFRAMEQLSLFSLASVSHEADAIVQKSLSASSTGGLPSSILPEGLFLFGRKEA